MSNSNTRQVTRDRSASRSDLVRYAGASLDFNPIHWDTEAARAAGLDDCVVHGMLIMAWAASAAAEAAGGAENLRRLKIRFKSPLYVGATASVGVEAENSGDGTVNLQVSVSGDDGSTLASGSGMAVREQPGRTVG